MILFCILFFSYSYSQKNFNPAKSDTLNKFSYVVFGLLYSKKNQTVYSAGGTAFFIKKNAHTFLIGAKHVFTPFFSKENKSALLLYIKDKKGCTTDFIVLQSNYTNLPTEDSVDLVCLEIFDSLNYKLHGVEQFVMPQFNKPNTIDVYGYGVNTYNDTSVIYGCTLPEHFHIINKSTKYYSDSLYKRDILIGNEFMKTDSTMHGYSGAPIFLQEKKTNNVRVMGVLIGSTEEKIKKENLVRCVSMDYVMEVIDKYLSVRYRE